MIRRTLALMMVVGVSSAALQGAPGAATEGPGPEGPGPEGVLPEGAAALDEWLARQAQMESWSADVVQIRTLTSLAQPLTARGRVWFAQPNRFRWELGDPPRTIALRTGGTLLVAYPRLGQVERYVYGEQEDPAVKQALALLEVGLPADPEAFHARYELLGASRHSTSGSATWRFELQPRERAARRLIERVNLEIAAEDSRLLATELVFPDGSTMRNEFSDHRLDPHLPEGIFELESGATGGAEREPGGGDGRRPVEEGARAPQ